MGKQFTFKDESLGQMIVNVRSFSYSMNLEAGRAFLSIHGTISRTGASCKFELANTRQGHKLVFRDAVVFDGTEPRTVALEVKNLLLQFVKHHPDIPESFRQRFMDCVIKHPRKE
jgi:hypothetical protein